MIAGLRTQLITAADDDKAVTGDTNLNTSASKISSPTGVSLIVQKKQKHPAGRNHGGHSKNLTSLNLNSESFLFLPEQVGNVSPSGREENSEIEGRINAATGG